MFDDDDALSFFICLFIYLFCLFSAVVSLHLLGNDFIIFLSLFAVVISLFIYLFIYYLFIYLFIFVLRVMCCSRKRSAVICIYNLYLFIFYIYLYFIFVLLLLATHLYLLVCLSAVSCSVFFVFCLKRDSVRLYRKQRRRSARDSRRRKRVNERLYAEACIDNAYKRRGVCTAQPHTDRYRRFICL